MADTKQQLDVEAGASPAVAAPVWSKAIANPAPLGLLAFGMTTFLLMSIDTLWSGKLFAGAVMGYAYAYGGFAQMVAGVLEVHVGDSSRQRACVTSAWHASRMACYPRPPRMAGSQAPRTACRRTSRA